MAFPSNNPNPNDFVTVTTSNLRFFVNLNPEHQKSLVQSNPNTFLPIFKLGYSISAQPSTLTESSKSVKRTTERKVEGGTINEKASRPSEEHISNGFPTGPNEFKRSGLVNLGNTCYLNATLQVLRNSLTFSHGVQNPTQFTKILMDFYMGEGKCIPNAIVDYLEQHLQVNLRKQSDAATYMDTICRMLEAEGSTMVLQKLEISLAPVEWQCQKCKNVIADPRKMKPSYSLILPESRSHHSDLVRYIGSAFEYQRIKNCANCTQETIQKGQRQLLNIPNHIVLVPQSPKTMDIKILKHFPFIVSQTECKFTLIGIVLHSGPDCAQWYYGGHYIALVKDGDKWFACNDSYVSEVRDISGFFHSYTPTIMVYENRRVAISSKGLH